MDKRSPDDIRKSIKSLVEEAESVSVEDNTKDSDTSKNEKDKKKSGSPEQEEEYYNDEFDEIDEDLPQNDDELEASGEGVRPSRVGESHGITVS